MTDPIIEEIERMRKKYNITKKDLSLAAGAGPSGWGSCTRGAPCSDNFKVNCLRALEFYINNGRLPERNRGGIDLLKLNVKSKT